MWVERALVVEVDEHLLRGDVLDQLVAHAVVVLVELSEVRIRVSSNSQQQQLGVAVRTCPALSTW